MKGSITKAWSLYDAKEYQKAVDILDEVLGQDENYDEDNISGATLCGDSLDALFLKGKLLLECGQFDEGEGYLMEIPETHSRYHEAQYLLGILYARVNGDLETGFEFFDKIPTTSDHYFSAKHEIGLCYSRTGESQKGLEILKSIPANYPKYGDVLHSIGHVYSEMDDEKNMLAYYDKVSKTDEAYGKAQISKATYLEKKGDFDGSLACLASVAPTDTYYLRTLENRSDMLFDKQMINEAISVWEAVPTTSEHYSYSLEMRAKLHANLEEFDKALELLAKIEFMSEEYLSALELTGKIKANMGDEKAAEKYAKWRDVYERKLCVDGILDSMLTSTKPTLAEAFDFWYSIPRSEKKSSYALLQCVSVCLDAGGNDLAKELFAQITDAERDFITAEYRYNMDKVNEIIVKKSKDADEETIDHIRNVLKK